MSKWDQYVYSYVPQSALKTIFSEGLYGGEALLKRPDLLEMVAKSRKVSPKSFEKEIRKNLSSWAKESSKGPNIVFQPIPKNFKVSSKHPTKQNKLSLVKINLTQLLSDYPDTKIFGMELKPYSEDVHIDDRHHFLSKNEINKLLSKTPKEIWETYNDIEDKGLYAPDVPHASIQTASGIILPEYLEGPGKISTANFTSTKIRNRVLFLNRLCERNTIS